MFLKVLRKIAEGTQLMLKSSCEKKNHSRQRNRKWILDWSPNIEISSLRTHTATHTNTHHTGSSTQDKG